MAGGRYGVLGGYWYAFYDVERKQLQGWRLLFAFASQHHTGHD